LTPLTKSNNWKLNQLTLGFILELEAARNKQPRRLVGHLPVNSQIEKLVLNVNSGAVHEPVDAAVQELVRHGTLKAQIIAEIGRHRSLAVGLRESLQRKDHGVDSKLTVVAGVVLLLGWLVLYRVVVVFVCFSGAGFGLAGLVFVVD